MERVSEFIFGGSKITSDGDCSHEIKRRLLLGRKVMTNLDSILKSRDINLPTKVHLVTAALFIIAKIWKQAKCPLVDEQINGTSRQWNIIVAVQSLSGVWLFAAAWAAAFQAPPSFTISQSLLKCMSTGLVMLSNHLILSSFLLLLPSNFPSIKFISSESALQIRWPIYWRFSFSINPSNVYSGSISFKID